MGQPFYFIDSFWKKNIFEDLFKISTHHSSLNTHKRVSSHCRPLPIVAHFPPMMEAWETIQKCLSLAKWSNICLKNGTVSVGDESTVKVNFCPKRVGFVLGGGTGLRF